MTGDCAKIPKLFPMEAFTLVDNTPRWDHGNQLKNYGKVVTTTLCL